jgi:phage-related protein
MAIHQITNPSNALGPIWIKNTWIAPGDRLRAAAKTSVDTKCATIQHNRELMNALSVVMTCLSELEVKHLTAIKDGVRRVETDRAANKAIRRA